MKKMVKDLRSMSIEQLEKEIIVLREEISKLRLEQNTRTKKDTNIVAKKCNKLAIMLTLITEKKEQELIKKTK